MTTAAKDLQPGTRVRHKGGSVVVLDRRKSPDDDLHGLPFHPGWWLRDSRGGLADFAIDTDDSDWTPIA